MVNEFNKIVGDVLATEGAVCLPDVGTLVVVRRAAERISSRRLRRSCNAVLFTDKNRGRSIVDAVAEICGVEESEAREIYDRWRTKSTADGVLAIDGVGHIDRRRFYVDDSFDRMLNPNGHRVVELQRLRNRTLRCVLWSAVAAVAVVCAVWWSGLYERRGEAVSAVASWFEPKEKPQPAEPLAAAAEMTKTAEPVQTEGGSEPDTAEDMNEASAAAGQQQEPQSETAQEQTPRQPEEPSEQSVGQPAELQQQAAQQKPLPVVPVDGIGRLTSGWSYVVYGVFSTPENAMRAVGEVRARGVNGCSAFAYGAKYMVALYYSDNASECNTYIRGAREYENLWVYTAH